MPHKKVYDVTLSVQESNLLTACDRAKVLEVDNFAEYEEEGDNIELKACHVKKLPQAHEFTKADIVPEAFGNSKPEKQHQDTLGHVMPHTPQIPNIGTIFDYDPETNKWVTITDPEQGWFTKLIHTLKQPPDQSLNYPDYGVSIESPYRKLAPDHDIYRTTKQYANCFKQLRITRIKDNPPTYRIEAHFFSGNPPKTQEVELSSHQPTISELVAPNTPTPLKAL